MLDFKYSYIGGYKYRLDAMYKTGIGLHPPAPVLLKYVRLGESGELVVLPGYCWDGPSGPTIDTEDFMRGALVHDCLYQMMREGALPKSYRKKADHILRKMCGEDGMPWWRRQYVYYGVRVFGGVAVSG